MKNNGQEDNTASKKQKKKKAMKSLDEMVKTDISKNETGKD